MYAIRSYYAHPLRDTLEDFLRNTQMTYTRDLLFQSYILTMADRTRDERSDVITSYSIHYTKLYEKDA